MTRAAQSVEHPPARDVARDPLPAPVVLSATFREADARRREALAAELAALGPAFDEHVLLHTCHRVELIGLPRPGPAVAPPAGVEIRAGADAVERALVVAGGLDSAVVAEEQLIGQVREAFETALSRGTSGPVLNELLRRALRFGKRVRSEARPGGDRSLADRAVRWVDERLGPEARPASALVVGSGEIGGLVAGALAARGMTLAVASRRVERAERLVARLSRPERARAVPLDDALARLGDHDLVAIAVRGREPILAAAHLPTGRPAPLVIDLSAPPAVAPDAARRLGDRLFDLDRLGADGPAALSPAAERRLRAAARDERDRFLAWLDARAGGDGMAALTAHADEIRRRHLARLRRSGRLDADQLAAVEASASAMIGELLHLPLVHLRRDPEAATLVRRVFGIDR